MKRWGLSGSTLKIVACVLMLCDHIGARLLPQYRILRIIGRLAFPIFAFCIAEGCRYTRHKWKHLGLIFGFGAVWEALLIYYYKEWDGNIFLTFSLSILLIYLWQWVKKQWATARRGSALLWLPCTAWLSSDYGASQKRFMWNTISSGSWRHPPRLCLITKTGKHQRG